MKKRPPVHHLQFPALTAVLLTAVTAADCAAGEKPDISWKPSAGHAVSSASPSPYLAKIGGVSIGLQYSDTIHQHPGFEQPAFASQGITFAYEAAAGTVGLSAGYIYSPHASVQEEPDRSSFQRWSPPAEDYGSNRSWYMALDISRSYRVGEDFSLAMGTRSMLFNTPLEEREGKTFSLLVNLPITYKNVFTITPELQWYRNMYDDPSATDTSSESGRMEDSFYGGVSISFSY